MLLSRRVTASLDMVALFTVKPLARRLEASRGRALLAMGVSSAVSVQSP
jgi:hypothetical protein